MKTSSSPKNDRPEGLSAPEARSPMPDQQTVATAGHALTLHQGLDYACIMRPEDTTDTALVQVKYPTDEDMALLQQMAASPELVKALRALVDAKALSGVRELVAGWNGEGRSDGPNPRHDSRLGATLPKTNCGAVYELDEALVSARAAIAKATGAA